MEEINLKKFFIYLKNNLYVIVIISLLFSFATFMYSKYIKVPLYETSTTLVLTQAMDNNSYNNTINQNDISLNQKLVSTYSELVKSKRVLNQVKSSLELKNSLYKIAKSITVSSIENTEILKISVRNKDATLSRDIANKTAEVFSNEVVKIYNINKQKIM